MRVRSDHPARVCGRVRVNGITYWDALSTRAEVRRAELSHRVVQPGAAHAPAQLAGVDPPVVGIESDCLARLEDNGTDRAARFPRSGME
jgi:hypothetical protein